MNQEGLSARAVCTAHDGPGGVGRLWHTFSVSLVVTPLEGGTYRRHVADAVVPCCSCSV